MAVTMDGSLSSLLALQPDAIAGVLLTPSGSPRALPHLPDHHLLDADSAVLTAARTCLSRDTVRAVFMTPQHGAASAPLLRVTVLSHQPRPTTDHQALILLSPPANLRGLTRRELQVLGLLIEGATSTTIATRLQITTSTAVNHLKQIAAKLHTTSLNAAAVRALRQGLYIPASLRPSLPECCSS